MLDRTANEHGIDLNIVAEMDSIALLYDFVASRDAYSIFPSIGIPPLMQRGVDYRLIRNPTMALQSYIVRGANTPKCKSVSAVVGMLEDIARDIEAPSAAAKACA